jgi:hypothetical protein
LQSFSRHGIAKMLSQRESKSENEDRGRVQKNGASEEIRTLDINLGKVALYQLSYTRVQRDLIAKYTEKDQGLN